MQGKRAKVFDFSFAEIPDSPSQEILDAGGYQLTAECDTNNNRPELNVDMRVPRQGRWTWRSYPIKVSRWTSARLGLDSCRR